jgi:hypothetical protein
VQVVTRRGAFPPPEPGGRGSTMRARDDPVGRGNGCASQLPAGTSAARPGPGTRGCGPRAARAPPRAPCNRGPLNLPGGVASGASTCARIALPGVRLSPPRGACRPGQAPAQETSPRGVRVVDRGRRAPYALGCRFCMASRLVQWNCTRLVARPPDGPTRRTPTPGAHAHRAIRDPARSTSALRSRPWAPTQMAPPSLIPVLAYPAATAPTRSSGEARVRRAHGNTPRVVER